MTAYKEFLAQRFGGKLYGGAHDPNGHACALESVAIYRGIDWTDDPAKVGLPDIRPLNDAFMNDDVRTENMVPLVEALLDWNDWTQERQGAFVQRVAFRTIREIIPIALDAVGIDSTACREATDLESARGAARAAEAAARAAAAARAGAAWAARAAAWGADGAAWAADAAWAARAADDAALGAAEGAGAAARAAGAARTAAARNDVVAKACRIWIEETRE